MQNFGVTNKEHYGMLWYFWSGQLFFLKLTEILLNFCQTSKVCNSLLSTDSKQLGSE